MKKRGQIRWDITSIYHFRIFGTLWHFLVNKNAYIGNKIRSTCGDHPDGVFWTKSGQFGPSDDHFRGQKARFRTILGLKTACLLMKWPFGIPRGAPKVQKWVSDTYCVNIGQFEHYVVFETKFGAVQDFQMGKHCPVGIKQTPLDPLIPPKTPLYPLSDPPYNQFNPSSYLITHWFSQNHPKNAKMSQICKNDNLR